MTKKQILGVLNPSDTYVTVIERGKLYGVTVYSNFYLHYCALESFCAKNGLRIVQNSLVDTCKIYTISI